jgi:hypothetical protein
MSEEIGGARGAGRTRGVVRVAHLVHYLNPFGMERVVLSLLRYRGEHYRDQIVVSKRDGDIAGEMRATGCDVHIEGVDDRVVDLLRDCDIVNGHCFSVHRGQEMADLARRAGKPYLLTLHWVTRFPADLSPIYICTSEEAVRAQPPGSVCELIENGIDLEHFRPRPETETERETTTLTRICRPQKCDEYFWYTMTDILARYPQVRLRLAGTDATFSAGQLQCVGIRPDVAPLLADTDLFVYTPRPNDGTKDLVVMEAAAMGVPAVYSDVACTRASAVHGETALLVPFGDAGALTSAVRRLLDDTALRRKLGEGARRYALDHFDSRQRVRHYEAVYDRLLGAPRELSKRPQGRGVAEPSG